ncbi:hypothetical protein CHGG_06635 [Chaetomium globosum CBS 148.51]|uniref:Uncharacterized protein n=1 Tax=Chaetomium globosum (strain ATCC 6205 / CBS 148.51 / DSM 1962 / NBRC 6347 / NRRL 1970) TaxID=306901 RepID=Q2H3Y0_CHAGB|nr:uncharacterized protein CHGG_06635 [Chaetomium globosum CBS 148.51]EAQ90016.1 hypothetical protein CHGG_06635 [Chaetomium globosum CBS 148.51]
MAAYAQNPNFKPLPPPGNYPQGYHSQAQFQQQQQQYHQQQQYLQQQQQYQQHQQQQLSPDGVHRPPSFVGLPPIRRASTFGSSLGLTAEEFSSTDNNNNNSNKNSNAETAARQQLHPQSASSPQGAQGQPTMAAAQQMGQAPPPSQSAGQFVQNVYRPTQGTGAQGPQGVQGLARQGQTWQLQGQNPGQNQAFQNTAFQNAVMQGQGPSQTPPRAFAGAPGNAQLTMNGSAPLAGQGQQFGQGGGRPMMVPPHMMPGNVSQRFHPQGGGWNLQESHLAEPLQPSSRHRHSPSNASSQQQQQSSYGLDKETGAPMTTSPVQRQKPSQEQQTQQSNDPTTPQPNQAMPANHQSPSAQQPDGSALSRLQSHQSHQSEMANHGPLEDGQMKRNSGVFSSIRNRFGGGHSEETRGADNGPKPQGIKWGTPPQWPASCLMKPDNRGATRSSGHEAAPPPRTTCLTARAKTASLPTAPGTPLGDRMGPGAATALAVCAPGAGNRLGFSTMGSYTNACSSHAPFFRLALRKNRFSALKDVFRSSPRDASKSPGSSFTVRMPAQNSPQPTAQTPPPQGQYQGMSQNQFQGQFQGQQSQPQSQGQAQATPLGQSQGQPPGQFQGQEQPHGQPQGQPQEQPQEPQPQGQPQGQQPQGQPQGQPHAPSQSLLRTSPSSQLDPTNAQPTTPGSQPDSSNTSPATPATQPGSAIGQITSGQGRFPPVAGPRQPGYGPPPMQPPQGPIPNQNQQERKPSTGIFGFLRGRSDSKSQEATQQSRPLGQGQPFPPGQGQFPGQQYGMRVPVGPDGRPATGAGQQFHPGQFPPQSQFMQPGPPGTAGSFQSQGGPGPQRTMTMPQQPGAPQGQQAGVLGAGQRPPMQTQPSQSSIQAQAEDRLGPNQQQGPFATAQQPQPQTTPQQEPANNAEPTPAASILESPVSQHSQPASQFVIEQSRFQTESPGSMRQMFAAPKNSGNQPSYHVPGAQSAAAAQKEQPICAKPFQPPSGSNIAPSTVPSGGPGEDNDMQRPVSPSSQAPPTSGIPGEEMERGAPRQPPPVGQFQNLESRLPSRQSPSAASPGQEAPASAHAPGSISGESAQGPSPTQQPPTQQLGQPGLRPPTGQQGGHMPSGAPGQGFPTNQAQWMASQPGGVPPQFRQQFGPGSARPNGVPVNAQPQKEKEQSTFSKLLFGGKSSAPAATGPKPEKEKNTKPSLMNAFKRGYRQPDAQPASQANVGRPGPGQPVGGMQPYPARVQNMPQQPQPQPQSQQGPGLRPGMPAQTQNQQQGGPIAAQGPPQVQQQQPRPGVPTSQQGLPPQMTSHQARPLAPEPQYAQVPIPAGYGYVHGEGRVAPAPAHIFVGPGFPPGQGPQPGFAQRQWVQPGVAPTQAAPAGVSTQPAPQQTNVIQASPASLAASTPQSQTPAPAQAQDRTSPGPAPITQERGEEVIRQQPAGQEIAPSVQVQAIQHPQNASAPAGSQVPEDLATSRAPAPAPAPQSPETSISPPEEQAKPAPPRTHTGQGNISPPTQLQYAAPSPSRGPTNLPVAQAGARTMHARNVSEDGIASLPSQRPGRVQSPSPDTVPSPASTNLAPRSTNTSPSTQPTPGWNVGPLPASQANPDAGRGPRTVSPEASAQVSSSPVNQLTTPTQRVAEDNLYDATPRQSQFPTGQQEPPQSPPPQSPPPQSPPPQSPLPQRPQPQQQPRSDVPSNTIVITAPVEPKSAGLSREVARPPNNLPLSPADTPSPPPPTITFDAAPDNDDEDGLDDFDDSDMESPIIADASIATVHQQASPSTSPTATAAAAAAQNGGAAAKDNVAIFERAKKKAEEQREAERRLMMEEKIPVFSEGETDPNNAKNDTEARPQMSATSYPGQEWNPYGDGFEGWDD